MLVNRGTMKWTMRWMRRSVLFLGMAAGALGFLGCNEDALKPQAQDAGPGVSGLSPEQAAMVLAKVGDKTITLGDFAQTLERMDQFDRLRYQTKERRRELLNELIDAELLALEAKKRGLDKQPEAQDAVRQILRDALLATLRTKMVAPMEIPAADVRAYYEKNQERFSEPERRRVAVIVLNSKAEAEKVHKAALKIKNATEWGDLFYKHSLTAPKTRPANAPLELAGDLGIVGAPDDPKGKNAQVPEPVRAAVFHIENVGSVGSEIIAHENKFYVLRMNGKTAAHHRSLSEADRTIRVALFQERAQQMERELEEDLRKKFSVVIDDQALASVKLPPAVEKLEKMDALSGATRPWLDGAGDAGAGSPEAGAGEPADISDAGP